MVDPKQRVLLFDVSRGLAILLVIIMHWQGWFSHSLANDGILYAGLEIVNTIFTPLRMEMLFFISGFFVKFKIGFFDKKNYAYFISLFALVVDHFFLLKVRLIRSMPNSCICLRLSLARQV